jgi:hypothetical protein
MPWSWAVKLLWLCVATILQLAWINLWPNTWPQPDLILVTLIFWLFAVGWSETKWWVVGTAAILGIISFYPLFFYVILWLLLFYCLYYLLFKIFTNKSIYSLIALMVLGTVGQYLGLMLLSHDWSAPLWWLIFSKKIIANALVTGIIYYLLRWRDKRLVPFFMVKGK